MFLLVPWQGIQIVRWKPTQATEKNLSCMGLPDMGFATVLWPPYSWTLWTDPFSYPPTTTTGSDDAPSFFTGDTPDTPATSIGNAVVACGSTGPAGGGFKGGGGGGVSVVIPLNNLSNCGRSPVPAASTASLNISHPSAIILCPDATVLTAER